MSSAQGKGSSDAIDIPGTTPEGEAHSQGQGQEQTRRFAVTRASLPIPIPELTPDARFERSSAITTDRGDRDDDEDDDDSDQGQGACGRGRDRPEKLSPCPQRAFGEMSSYNGGSADPYALPEKKTRTFSFTDLMAKAKVTEDETNGQAKDTGKSEDSTVEQNDDSIFRIPPPPRPLADNTTGTEIANVPTTPGNGNAAAGGIGAENSGRRSTSPTLADDENGIFLFHARILNNTFSVEAAERYLLNRKSAEDLCEHNVKVAKKLDLKQAILIWKISQLYCKILAAEVESKYVKKPPPIRFPIHTGFGSNNRLPFHCSADNANNNNNAAPVAAPASTSEEEKPEEDNVFEFEIQRQRNLFDPPPHSYQFSFDSPMNWRMKPEAFEPWHGLGEFLSLEDDDGRPLIDCDMNPTLETVIKKLRAELKLKLEQMNVVSELVPGSTAAIEEALDLLAKMGDVQTAVCAWIILSSVCELNIDSKVVKAWCDSYIEMLRQKDMHVEAALIVKLSGEILGLAPEATTFAISCVKCGNRMPNSSKNYCPTCKELVAHCSICKMPVLGLITWCDGCGHGGHPDHWSDWFLTHDECPTRCGHNCKSSSS